MNDDEIKSIISKHIDEFADANTLCYSNHDLFNCKGNMFELKYRFDIIVSKLWVCEKCLMNMQNENSTDIEVFL